MCFFEETGVFLLKKRPTYEEIAAGAKVLKSRGEGDTEKVFEGKAWRRTLMEAKRLCAAGVLALLAACSPYSGTCKTGSLGDCPQGTVCYALGSTEAGMAGECVVGELDAEGRLKVTVKSWKLFREGEEVVPLRFDENDVEWALGAGDNPAADWLGNGVAELRLWAMGSVEAERRLEVVAQGVAHPCKHVPGKCWTANCEWACTLPEGWAGPGPETEVVVKVGEQGLTRKRSYRVSAAPPKVSLRTNASTEPFRVGDTLELCVAQESDLLVPITSWGTEGLKLFWGTLEIPVKWEEAGGAAPNGRCWRTVFPLTTTQLGEVGESEIRLEGSFKVANIARNTFHISEDIKLRLTRIVCKTGVVIDLDYVTQPLAFSSGRLIFASSGWPAAVDMVDNSLFFYNERCEVVADELFIGSTNGPMVVLGNTGHIAIAIRGGGPRRIGNSHLTIVDTTRRPVDFYYADDERDCGGVTSHYFGGNNECLAAAVNPPVTFRQGLMLARIGDGPLNPATDTATPPSGWRFAATGNPGAVGDSRMLSFSPDQRSPCARCGLTALNDMQGPIFLTPIQVGNAQTSFVAVRLRQRSGPTATAPPVESVGCWNFDTIGRWNSAAFLQPPRYTLNPPHALEEPTGLAAAGRDIWLSGASSSGPTLQRWDSLLNAPLVNVQTGLATSPAAIDAEGRPHVVVQVASGYQLRRFRARAGENEPPDKWEPLPAGISSPVGSPILGEPVDGSTPAEIYVITTDGSVLAFDADTLKHLWTQRLGLSISPTAQPLLVGNTLWVLGTQGQMLGLRVASRGLNRKAAWPKAFRDNCNTSAQISTPTDDRMSVCF